MQAVFLLSFVLRASWAGRFADRHSKGRVLAVGNAIKALGAAIGALIAGFETLIDYRVVGSSSSPPPSLHGACRPKTLCRKGNRATSSEARLP